MSNPTEEYLPGSDPSKKRKKKPFKSEDWIISPDSIHPIKYGTVEGIGLDDTWRLATEQEINKVVKKKPTGIFKDLLELKRYSVLNGVHVRDLCGTKVIKVEDVEAIINKYLNP